MGYAVQNLNLENKLYQYKINFINKWMSKGSNCINVLSNDAVFGIEPVCQQEENCNLKSKGTFISYYPSYGYPTDNTSDVYRVFPQDSFRIKALLDITRALEWKYVPVISSHGRYGRLAQRFIDKLEEADSCLHQHYELPLRSSQQSFDEIEKFTSNAVVSFTVAQDTIKVIKNVDRIREGKIQILFAYGPINYDEIGEIEKANGTLFLDFSSEELPAFSEYICKNDCNKYKSKPEWCKRNTSLCKEGRPSQDSYLFSPFHLVIKAVQSLTEAIENSASSNINDINYMGLKARKMLVRGYLHKKLRCGYISPMHNTEENGVITYDIINLVSNELRVKISIRSVE